MSFSNNVKHRGVTSGLASPMLNKISVLLLGEGDFSFSYDLAQFLSFINTTKSDGSGKKSDQTRKRFEENLFSSPSTTICISATGIDSAQELQEKYKDSSFLVSSLKALNQDHFQVQVCHEVNAILHDKKIPESSPDDEKTSSFQINEESASLLLPSNLKPATFVVFNHPHLGIEDAARHTQFLYHLFYSVARGWMTHEARGRFFLALATGQWERWQGPAASHKYGFELLGRDPFSGPVITDPPPGESEKLKSYYQQRRHQTGKSFAARAQSEIFTFRRIPSGATLAKNSNLHREKPFWITSTKVIDNTLNQERKQHIGVNGDVEASAKFFCEHCKKAFREERSLKNHIRSKHQKRKRDDQQKEKFPCSQCSRVFETKDGLRDHVSATHSGLHSEIKPDWFREGEEKEQKNCMFTCDVCGGHDKSQLEHMSHFVPGLLINTQEQTTHKCSFCGKTFREKRGQLQHENFCASRHKTTERDVIQTS